MVKFVRNTTTPKLIKITATGGYTPTPGMRYIKVELIGGGGGSGGITASGSPSDMRIGGGGGAGGYICVMLNAAQVGASQPVNIGAGGTGGGGNTTGNTGADSTFGALLTARGGLGGTVVSAGGFAMPSANGGRGGGFIITTGTDIGSSTGLRGENGFGMYILATSSALVNPGAGGDSPFGIGGKTLASTQNAASTFTLTPSFIAEPNTGTGGAGVGAFSNGSTATTATNGQAGAAGVCLITEYFI